MLKKRNEQLSQPKFVCSYACKRSLSFSLDGASGTPPIRSELSRQFPRTPMPAPLFGSSEACLDSQRGPILFQPYLAFSDFSIAGRCQQAISSPILLIARQIASKKRRPRTYAELRCRVHEDLVA